MQKEVKNIKGSKSLFSGKKIRFCLVLFVVFLFASLDVYSQSSRDGVLGITGWVLTDKDEPMRKASVYIYEADVLVAETKTNRRGRFMLELPIDRKYVAEYISEGYATKKMSFNTGLPNDFKGFNVFYFEFIVELFPWCSGVDYALLETPYIEIAYMNDKEEFFFNEMTARPMLAKVEELKLHTYEMLLAQTEQQELIDSSDDMLAEFIDENKTEYDNNEEIVEELIIEQIIAETQQQVMLQSYHSESQLLAQQSIAVNIDYENGNEDNLSENISSETDYIGYEATTNESLYYSVEESDKMVAYFDFASYALDEASIETLKQAVNNLNVNPDKNLLIYGHTDKRGNSLFNFYLSQLRAQIANEYFINEGISADRIITIANGQDMPVMKNAIKESEHKMNRRIEIEFVDKSDFENISKYASQITYRCINNPNDIKKFSRDVEYMVQFIASKKPVGYSFFHRIIEDYPETNIVYYYDNDNLHRYLIGSYKSIEEVRNAAIKLREIGYEAYVVAFADGKRISLTEARLALEGSK
jgi:outer membrane protein OmpA-like peptidoglycan-associated protein